eukprot:GGOE01018093.1.p1 GENE.GGOE01018093.1~~GGOE01018093.1.p1  ORF type:complete len:327 (+),score=114.48 GGOE01018093.1:54-983(+)
MRHKLPLAAVQPLKQKVAFIGAGTMAEAMMAGMLSRNLIKPQQILACGPRMDRIDFLKTHYGVQGSVNNEDAATMADVVVLSVKPQLLNRVLDGLPRLRPETLLLSIVAGATTNRIGRATNHSLVVRAMPNTPASIGEGITVWTSSSGKLTPAQREVVVAVLETMGEQIYVEDENQLDMATALSGSGPAYVCLFMEALIDSGVHMGFSRRIAERLVMRTIKGTCTYLEEKKIHPSMMRNDVCSPGGTSAEALYFLEKEGFRTAVSRACWAAFQRSMELGAKDVLLHIPENYTSNPTALRDYTKHGKLEL